MDGYNVYRANQASHYSDSSLHPAHAKLQITNLSNKIQWTTQESNFIFHKLNRKTV